MLLSFNGLILGLEIDRKGYPITFYSYKQLT